MTYNKKIVSFYEESSLFTTEFDDDPENHQRSFMLDITAAAEALDEDVKSSFIQLPVSVESQRMVNRYLEVRRVHGYADNSAILFPGVKWKITHEDIKFYDNIFNISSSIYDKGNPGLYEVMPITAIDYTALFSKAWMGIRYKKLEGKRPSLFYRAVNKSNAVFLLAWLAPTNVVCYFDVNLRFLYYAKNSIWSINHLINNGLDAVYTTYTTGNWIKFDAIELKVLDSLAESDILGPENMGIVPS